MRRSKKALGLMLTLAMTASVFAGCGSKGDDESPTPTQSAGSNNGDTGNNGDSGNNGDVTPAKEPLWKSLDPNISGAIDVMVWSGDSLYHEDLGHQNLSPEDITSQNVAAVYALAKEFNKFYPNLKINLYAKADDPNGNDTSWQQELENFRAEHGKYPDIYAANDLPGDVSRGFVADLSVFSDDVLYQSFNESIMNAMAYYGFQAALPQFVQPWGVYINKALAESNNIEIPDPDWTFDEYTEFVTSVDGSDDFWGAMDTPLSFISTGTTTINAQMANYSGTGDRVNLTSDEVSALLAYIPQWAKSAVWVQYGLGNISDEIMNNGGWWGFSFFCRNYLLTYDGDPWMLNTAGMPQNADGSWPANAVESSDWDIYPRPSTPYQGNTLSIVIDPMAIHNFAMDDGNPEWSESEKAQLELAYAFGSFWCGATESMQARADQQYNANGTIKSCLNDSFPLVTGDAFDEQMKIWYSVDVHERYGNADLMPGFQYVMELWEKGQFWDISDKCYPYYIMEDGTQKTCLYEWLNATQYDVAGAGSADANWLDNVKARLGDWNTAINARFVQAEASIKDGLKQYYGMTDADFK